MPDYTKICFVVMPFGAKPIGSRRVPWLNLQWSKKANFDRIYDDIFAPAIASTPLPEGGKLEPRRTDRDLFTSDITQDMFEYLEYSRMVLADISSPNENVFYELGVRHRSRGSGTAIFRQSGALIPFDINHIKAFPYEYKPVTKAAEARQQITKILTESLKQLRLDSPVLGALRTQQTTKRPSDHLLHDGERALLAGDKATAISKWCAAVNAGSGTAIDRVRLGLLYKDRGEWQRAAVQFEEAVREIPDYAEAHRELGIAKNKRSHEDNGPVSLNAAAEELPGEDQLKQALRLNEEDFDAAASLGGLYKRAGRLQDAIHMYKTATQISNGHPYPLLNLLKLEAEHCGKLEISPEIRRMLESAERFRMPQAKMLPAYDAPWSHFDLAEIGLFLGASEEAILEFVDAGITASTALWQISCFHDSLQRLELAGISVPALAPLLMKLQQAVQLRQRN